MATPRWTDEGLESMRHEGDPEADRVVEALFAQGRTDAVTRLHHELVTHEEMPQDLPPVLVEYLRDTAGLPDWADPEQIEIAERVLMSHGLIAFAILACASLPECYADVRGVPVLWLTQKLNVHAHRRIYETSQLVLDVLQPGGLTTGSGVLAAQKVRLMHASIRHLILADPTPRRDAMETPSFAGLLRQESWNRDLGQPINQEDLAYTLQTFAWVTVRSLRQLDAGLTPEEEEALIHAWNVVGHHLGVRRELQPGDVAEAEELFESIKRHTRGTSDATRSLAAALLDFLESFWTGHLRIERIGLDASIDTLRFLPRMLMHEFLDEETAGLLGLPKESGFDRLRDRFLDDTMGKLVDLEERIFRHASPARRMADLFFHVMLEKMVRLPRGFERDLFAIPTSLATSWRLVPVNP